MAKIKSMKVNWCSRLRSILPDQFQIIEKSVMSEYTYVFCIWGRHLKEYLRKWTLIHPIHVLEDTFFALVSLWRKQPLAQHWCSRLRSVFPDQFQIIEKAVISEYIFFCIWIRHFESAYLLLFYRFEAYIRSRNTGVAACDSFSSINVKLSRNQSWVNLCFQSRETRSSTRFSIKVLDSR